MNENIVNATGIVTQYWHRIPFRIYIKVWYKVKNKTYTAVKRIPMQTKYLHFLGRKIPVWKKMAVKNVEWGKEIPIQYYENKPECFRIYRD